MAGFSESEPNAFRVLSSRSASYSKHIVFRVSEEKRTSVAVGVRKKRAVGKGGVPKPDAHSNAEGRDDEPFTNEGDVDDQGSEMDSDDDDNSEDAFGGLTIDKQDRYVLLPSLKVKVAMCFGAREADGRSRVKVHEEEMGEPKAHEGDIDNGSEVDSDDDNDSKDAFGGLTIDKQDRCVHLPPL
jgi:hypothetical protein